jgi:hypothetical protein
MRVAFYLLFRAECRFSLGSRVPAWGARVPWCRAGWPCSWCAARRGGCRIIRVDRAPRVDRVPPGGPDPPGRPFPPGYLPGPGAGGAPGPRGEQEPGGQGFRGRGRSGRFAGRGRAEAMRPPWGSWGSAVPGGPDLPRLPDRRPGPAWRGLCATRRGWPHLPAVPAATGHTVTVASITRRPTEPAGPLGDLSKTPLSGRMPHSFVFRSVDSLELAALTDLAVLVYGQCLHDEVARIPRAHDVALGMVIADRHRADVIVMAVAGVER